ncbi:MAG: universal stress protein [Natronomonas sp.]
MYRVLLPLDNDEERANAQVDTLLDLPGDPEDLSVVIVHVYEEIDTPADEGGSVLIQELNESLEELRDLPPAVDLVENRLEEAGIEYERREKVGEAAPGILDTGEDVDADAILLGSGKHTRVGKALFGSVSQDVILEADIPVIIIH